MGPGRAEKFLVNIPRDHPSLCTRGTLLIKHQAYGIRACRHGSQCILNAGNTANFNSGSQSFCLILG